MEAPKVSADVALRLERRIAATPEKVFAAWTRPEAITRWFSPTGDYTVFAHDLDVRVGGKYRIEMRHVGGNSSVAHGVYREVSPPGKLVFTWFWEDRPEMAESLVTVTIQPEGPGSRLIVVHERLAEGEDRDKHGQGWNGCLDRLVAMMAAA